MGMWAVARGAYKADQTSEQTIAYRILEPDAIGNALARGDMAEIEARIDAASLYDGGPRGRYTIEEQRERKLRLGAGAADVVARCAVEGIGANLRAARQRARMTQADAAKAAGISHTTLSRIECGKRTVTLREALALAVIYGARLERVLGLMDADTERLLDVYEAASPTNRRFIIQSAELFQSGGVERHSENANKDFASHMRGIIEAPETTPEFRDATQRILDRFLSVNK